MHPQKDDKILTDWNGLMMSAMARSAGVFDDERYRKYSINAAEFAIKFLFNDNHLCEASILPPCILEIINFTEQNCDVAYEEDDFQFIQELIIANKIDTNGTSAVNEIYDNVHWTTTDNKNEFDTDNAESNF